jgi:hypothetical protein
LWVLHCPARRRPSWRDAEIRRFRAGKGLAQRRLIRRPGGHGLHVPSEGQHVENPLMQINAFFKHVSQIL